jgi:hypothetical protein
MSNSAALDVIIRAAETWHQHNAKGNDRAGYCAHHSEQIEVALSGTAQ